MSSNVLPEENLNDIRRRLDEAKKELDALEMQPDERLFHFEHRVKRHSDKILALKVAEQIQRQQIEQDARDAEKELKKKNC